MDFFREVVDDVAGWSVDKSSVFTRRVEGVCGADVEWVLNEYKQQPQRDRAGEGFWAADVYPLALYVVTPENEPQYELGYSIHGVGAGEDMDLRSSDEHRWWFVRSMELNLEFGGDDNPRWPSFVSWETFWRLGFVRLEYVWSPRRVECVVEVSVVGRVVLPDGSVRVHGEQVQMGEGIVRGLEESRVVNRWFVPMQEDAY